MNPSSRSVPTEPARPPAAPELVSERVGHTPNSSAPPRIPAQWQWHHRTLLHLRSRLMHAHADHATQAGAPAELRGVDLVDTAQDKMDRDLLWAELGAEDDQLFEIDCALQRIREGTYGFCEDTGNAIPEARLRALPWTRYCRVAAERHEQSARRR
jgi:RNA polymerase-binding transcription factor DksA